MQLLLWVCMATLDDYSYGEGGRKGVNNAYSYVVKDAESFARDFRNHLAHYVNEVRSRPITTRPTCTARSRS